MDNTDYKFLPTSSLSDTREKKVVIRPSNFNNTDKNGPSAEVNDLTALLQMKVFMSQLCAISGPVLISMTFGMSVGFTTILTAELTKKDAEIKATENELTWISSVLMISIPVGALLSVLTVRYVGQRGTQILSSIGFMVLWVLIYFATTAEYIIVAILLMGIATGLFESPFQVYVAECCQPRIRSAGCTSAAAGVAIGIFLQIAIGSYVYWRNVVMINIFLPLTALVVFIMLPESPYWLARMDQLDASKRSLCWLRGWTTPDQVKEEYNTIIKYTRKTQKVEKSKVASMIKTLKRCGQRSYYYPFTLSVFAFFLSIYNGQSITLIFAVLMMKELHSPINNYHAASVLTIMQIIGMVGSIFVWPTFGKRKPTLWSLVITGLAFLLAATSEYLRRIQDNHQGPTTTYSWITFTAISMAVLVSSLGIRCLPWTLTSELFPAEIRGPATTLALASSNIQSAIAYKIYLYVVKLVTWPGTFIGFAVINFVGFAIMYRVMPETEGVSLADIEKLFSTDRKDDGYGKVELDPLTI